MVDSKKQAVGPATSRSGLIGLAWPIVVLVGSKKRAVGLVMVVLGS